MNDQSMLPQAPLAPPISISAVLAQVATVVKVKSSSLGLTRLDKQASRESDANHNAQAGVGRVNVQRLAGAGADRVKAISSKVTEIKAEVYMRSTAYKDERLVANTMLQDMLGIWHVGKREYDLMIDALVADAPMLIDEANVKLGQYNVDPPTEDEIRNAFSLTLEVSQIPDTSHYKASGVTADLEADMKRRFDDSIAAAYQAATQDALTRVATPLGHLVERMTDYSKGLSEKDRGITSGAAPRLYESTITNVQDIAKVFRSFNMLGDPVMDKLATALDAFNGIGVDDLKGSQHLRDDVAKKAAAILESLKDLI